MFPEVAGHLALLALAPPSAHKAKTLGAALAAAAVRRPLDVLRGAVDGAPARSAATRCSPRSHPTRASGDGRVRAARAQARPRVRGRGLAPAARTDGDLTNASLLFGPDGRLVATTDKVNLVPGLEDRVAKGGLGLRARRRRRRADRATRRSGKLCTLICYDGFREPHTSNERFVAMGPRMAARGGRDVVANPAANPWPWASAVDLRGAGERARARSSGSREGLRGSLAADAVRALRGDRAPRRHACSITAFDGQSEILEYDDAHGAVRQLARAEAPRSRRTRRRDRYVLNVSHVE